MYKDINFSLWCDFLEREFISSEFVDLIEKGIINGATSNPSIFKSAILNSQAYESSKNSYPNKTPKELYEILATQDIKVAATKLLKNYANGDDGFVSLEVDPNLKNDSHETYKEGKRLYNTIKMPNVMIKVPATFKGFIAMQNLIKRGINVNATLVFSISQVRECLQAFKIGTEKFKKRFPLAPLPKAVISVFVSRFDRLLDAKFKAANFPTARYGINNAMAAYNEVNSFGLENVRILFASTGVKGNELEPDYYMKELLLPNCVNTAPLDTIKAFINSEFTAKKSMDKAELDAYFADTEKLGVNYEETCAKLLKDGLKSFEEAFAQILSGLEVEK